MKTSMPKNPMQPFVMKGDVVRFKENAIVRHLLDWASERGMSLNELACMDFSNDDFTQLAQLIGYSLRGFHELSYVSDESALAASEEARKILPECGGCRDDGCPIHSGMGEEE